MSPAEVLARIREAITGWQEPAVRHARAVRRARVSARRQSILAAAATAAAAVFLPLDNLGLPDVGWAALAAGTLTGAVFAHRRLRELERVTPPPAAPARTSMARPAVDRLARASVALRAQLHQLGPTVAETGDDAADAERALRELAARISTVEAALAVAPVEARAGLSEARRVLLDRLTNGVAAYERTVAVAGECVAASSGHGGDALALHRLAEAADALCGLAEGWRQAREVEASAGL